MADGSLASAASRRPASFASFAIDAIAVALVALVALLTAPEPAWAWAVAALLVALTGMVLWRGVLGGSPGHALMRLCSVDSLTGLPSFRFHARRSTVDRGGAESPYALRPRPVAIAHPPLPDFARGESSRSYLRLVVDDGTFHTVSHTALIGRDPAALPDTRHVLIAIPDLTRTVSKAHLLIEVVDDGVTVTDLRSANGTLVLEGAVSLVPEQPTPVAWGSTLLIGDRQVLLERRVREAS